jgi:hypothetical protein
LLKKYLSKKERTTILSKLSDCQKTSLFSAISMSHKSYFANILAKYKATEKWAFEKYIDHESIQENIRCMCGKKLRHEFIRQNIKTGEKRSIGVVHLQEELNIPDDIARKVIRGIHRINYNLDEILYKWNLGIQTNKFILDYWSKLKISEEIEMLKSVNLPLLEIHEKELFKQIKNLGNGIKTNHDPYVGLHSISRKILLGNINSMEYFNRFWRDIESYLKKRKGYFYITDLLGLLEKQNKIPRDFYQGKQVLLPYFERYLLSRNELIFKGYNTSDIKFMHKDQVNLTKSNSMKIELEFKTTQNLESNYIIMKIESAINYVSVKNFNPNLYSFKNIYVYINTKQRNVATQVKPLLKGGIGGYIYIDHLREFDTHPKKTKMGHIPIGRMTEEELREVIEKVIAYNR